MRYRALISVALAIGTTPLAAQEAADSTWIGTPQPPFYFAVRVADAEVSASWYGRVLGLAEFDRSGAPDGAWQIINLRSSLLFVEVIRDNRASPAERPQGLFKVGFQVLDVHRVADAAERVTGTRPRVLDFPDHQLRLVQLRDPDGNVLQLFSPLGSAGPP